MTIVETICAAGYALPPMVINKSTTQYKCWYMNLTATIAGYCFAFSPNGWTDDTVALKWLTELFKPCTAFLAPLSLLLILDGHGSHIAWEFVTLCRETTIILFCLLSQSIHLLQPLNIEIFSSLENTYGWEVDKYSRNSEERIKKSVFIPLLHDARIMAITKHNIEQGFATTGIMPFNSQRVYEKIKPGNDN